MRIAEIESVSENQSVLLLANDLMLSSTVGGIVLAEGLTFQNPASVSAAVSLLQSGHEPLVLIDLEVPGLDVNALAKSMTPETLLNSIAYGPHVHTERLDAARRAGIGTVMSRGQFSAQVGRLIKEWAAD